MKTGGGVKAGATYGETDELSVRAAGSSVSYYTTPEEFATKLRLILDYKNKVITQLYGGDALSYDEIYAQYRDFGERLREYVTNTAEVVQDAHERGEQILLERGLVAKGQEVVALVKLREGASATEAELAASREWVRQELMQGCASFPERVAVLAGVGGTITVLAALEEA